MTTSDNFWHKKFDQESYFYGTQPNDFLRLHAHHIPTGGRVLSIGEGEGRNAVYLAEQGYEVTALDAAQSGLDKVKKLADQRGVQVKTQLVDLEDYVFEPAQWEGIVSIFCHLPALLRQHVHAQIGQSLNTNGVFLLEAYRPKQLEFKTGAPSHAALLYEAAILQEELSGLHFELLQEIERSIYEGDGHQGMSAVVQVLARKRKGGPW